MVQCNSPFGFVLEALASKRPEIFAAAEPFPHIVVDGLFDPDLISVLHRTVIDLPSSEWEETNDPGVEVKLRSRWQSEYCIPEPAREVVRFFNSGPFLRTLSALTGIPHLIADPYYTGGGFNLLRRGGHLDVHVDGNWHHTMAVHRRLNVILFLNQDWRPEWGGGLGLYDAIGCSEVVSIGPAGNRLVIFETRDRTYHGQPEPILCPATEGRTSIILYYYTAAPLSQSTEKAPHRAQWRSRGWKDKSAPTRPPAYS